MNSNSSSRVDGVVLHRERIQHRAHGAADQRLPVVELAKRAALGDEHDQRDLVGHRQRGQHIGERGEAARSASAPRRAVPPIQAPETMPTASSSRAVAKVVKNGIGVQVLDQRRQHAVGHVGHQADVVALERLQHDARASSCRWTPCAAWGEVCCSASAIAFSLEPRDARLGSGRRGGLPKLDAGGGIVNMSGPDRDLRQTACRGRHRHVISGDNAKTGGTHGRMRAVRWPCGSP